MLFLAVFCPPQTGRAGLPLRPPRTAHGLGFSTVEGAATLPLWRPSFTFEVGYHNRPLSLYRTTDQESNEVAGLVEHLMMARVGAAVGFRHLDLGLSLPLALLVEGEGGGELVPLDPSSGFGGPGDLDISLRGQILNPERAAVGVALLAGWTAPIGGDWLGEHGWTFRALLSVEAQLRWLRVGADVGWLFRPPTSLGPLTIDDELWLGTAVEFRPTSWLGLGAELTARLGLPQGVTNADAPVELLGSASVRPTGRTPVEFRVSAGGGLTSGYGASRFQLTAGLRLRPDPRRDRDGDGIADVDDDCASVPEDRDRFDDGDGCPDPDNDRDGIPDAADACPDEPEIVNGIDDRDGCPDRSEGADRDGDGIADALDLCPGLAEDPDGTQDSDGCPDPDNDGDGLLDTADACPSTPGPPQHHGCPAPPPGTAPIDPPAESPVLLQPAVFFRPQQAWWEDEGEVLLGQLLQRIAAAGEARIEVRGHAADPGTEEWNLALSQARADAVRGALIEAGIDASRIVAIGMGRAGEADPTRARRAEVLLLPLH